MAIAWLQKILGSVHDQSEVGENPAFSLGIHEGGVSRVACAGGTIYSTTGKEPVLRRADAASGTRLDGVPLPVEPKDFAIDPTQSRVAITDGTATVNIVGLPNGDPSAPITLATPVSSLAWFVDGKRLAAGHEDGSVSIVDTEGSEAPLNLKVPSEPIEKVLEKPPGTIRQLAVSKPGTHVAAVDANGLLLVWNIANGNQVATIHLMPPSMSLRVEMSPDGRYVLVSGGTFTLSVQFGGGQSSVDVTDIAGFVFLKDLDRDETHRVRLPGSMVENAVWGRSDDEILVLIDVPPMKQGMKRRLAAFPLSALLKEDLSHATSEWWLGRGPLLVTSGFDRDTATFLLAQKEELLAWSVR